MKKFTLLIGLSLILILFGTACSKTKTPSPVPEPTGKGSQASTELKVKDFFPLGKNVYMKYKGSGNEYAEYETYVDYLKGNVMQVRNINPGTVSVFVYELTEDTLKKVFNKGEVYYRYDYTSSRNSDEEILIKEPLKVGNSWTLKDGTVRSITAIDKEVSTPAGNYKALEVTSKGSESTVTDYYVQNIGHVKRVFKTNNDSLTVTSELEKIEKDVPYKQKIRLYFPDFAKDRIVYLDREVEIRTNEDMKYKFQRELKTIPDKSVLSKVLTTNTQVSSPIINEEKNTVTVDFSDDLAKEMNAGSSLEAMIIKSIVNTIGDYYQKQRVIITIDGKPYSSGHIEMKQGEYFTPELDKAVEYKS